MSLTWDEEVELIASVKYEEDEIGQKKALQEKRKVCCCRLPVARNEFYKARQNGIEVSEILTVHPYEYNGENAVVFQGKELRVVRVYRKNMEECELTCTEKVGDKHA
ncbi:phage head closure protein [Claveliimonas bilis]|uniref:phage head closure protein n=1 Tax=Claveliimonas bilis TaxID=3028070 RepID=UPI00292FE002|nr:phage head closure protein [Claveliimonas bilis]BDZ81413.1 hypothetical protein Lac3_26220 [Claveliimonas bilis]